MKQKGQYKAEVTLKPRLYDKPLITAVLTAILHVWQVK